MSEFITPTRIEDSIAAASTFMHVERGAQLDGSGAAFEVKKRINDEAQEMLSAIPYTGRSGWYVPLSKDNVNHYDEVVRTLPNHMVIVPSTLVETGTSYFYPAIVSEDSVTSNALRLHVLRQPYRRHISRSAEIILSAAGQSETEGMGEHGRLTTDSIEAEHFAALLAAGTNEDDLAAWRNGLHVNHDWRVRSDTSVTSKMSDRLFDDTIPQSTLTLTKEQIERGQALILWHEGLRDSDGNPASATHIGALVVAQSLGFATLRQKHPQAIDTIKRLIA